MVIFYPRYRQSTPFCAVVGSQEWFRLAALYSGGEFSPGSAALRRRQMITLLASRR
jgi:hypothetical protein